MNKKGYKKYKKETILTKQTAHAKLAYIIKENNMQIDVNQKNCTRTKKLRTHKPNESIMQKT